MAKEFDVMYYEYMIESVNANREINELLMNVGAARLLNESCDELAVYEANVFNTIFEKIKQIFDRVINFFKGLFKKVAEEKVCVQDENLVKKVEDKIKSISNEDRNKFSIKDASIAKKVSKWNETYNNGKKIADEKLEVVSINFKSYMNGGSVGLGDEEYSKVVDVIKNSNDVLDGMSTPDFLKKDAEDVTYKDIPTILSLYRSSESTNSKLKENLVKVTKEMEDKQKEFDGTKGSKKDIKASDISNYQNVIVQLTNFLIKLEKTRLNVSTALFNNQEAILKAFVGFNPEKQVETNKTSSSTAVAVR